jgi:hypothetical protein
MQIVHFLKPTVHYVSAPCGAGKTYAACRFIADYHGETNFLYVAPSRELIEQTKRMLEGFGVQARAITSDTHANRVKSAIVDFLNATDDAGEVLLITWNAYVDLAYFNRSENWEVIIDEVPQLAGFYGWTLPRNLCCLTDHIDIAERSVNDKFGRIIVKDRDALEKLFVAARDDVHELFRPFFRDLLSPNKDMFVDLASWDRLVERGAFSDKDASNRICFCRCFGLVLSRTRSFLAQTSMTASSIVG